jgi:hypothetical protein
LRISPLEVETVQDNGLALLNLGQALLNRQRRGRRGNHGRNVRHQAALSFGRRMVPLAGSLPIPPPAITIGVVTQPTEMIVAFKIILGLAEDRLSMDLTLPTSASPQRIDAEELSDLIRQLAWIRASMLPALPPVDLTPETQISSVPAIRWQATEDSLPEQSRLFLLHPGFGWSYIPLNRASFDDMSAKLRLFLQPRAKLQ